MKSKLFLLGAALVLAGSAFAADKPQTLCPISGEKVDKKTFVDYQGQRVYFCCNNCVGKFKKDPEKTFAKLAADGVVPESVQKKDPVCGMNLMDKSVQADWKGRRLRFCSDTCKESFLKDPAKYLKTLDEKPAAKS